MIAAVLCVTSALVSTTERTHVGNSQSRATSFIYLASFVMHLGAQVWMTFVSGNFRRILIANFYLFQQLNLYPFFFLGLSLYFALPRHTFGEVQRILFPRYFTINACLSFTTLLIFVKYHPIRTWNTEIAIQVCTIHTRVPLFNLECINRFSE